MSAGLVFCLALLVFAIAGVILTLEHAARSSPSPSPFLDEGPAVALYALLASVFVMFLCLVWWVYHWLAWLQMMVTP